jgi:neutral ceramidase
LDDTNANRSPTSYLENPQEERDQYPDGDTDKTMTLLKFTKKQKDGKEKLLGVLNWYAVHATSMNNTNTLISGDNKGYASYELEKYVNSNNGEDISLPGHGEFVAAFASTNLGDVSPNTKGAKCIDTGEPCEMVTSTCNGRCEKCIAFGPGYNGNMIQSTQIIGHKQAEFAKNLMNTATEEIKEGNNGVEFRHSYVQFNKLNVTLSDDTKAQLCNPSMGYAFAAGTTDGPGMFGFQQHTTTGNPFWNKVADFLAEPTPEEIACQAPKPILINTGDIAKPYEWDPTTLGLQIFKIGNLFIMSVPSEFTTMSGRRARKTVQSIVQDMLPKGVEAKVVIAGLSNGYSSYVTTHEEYSAQRYEAASTIFGPNTLAGYIQELSRIATNMVKNEPSTTDAPPKDMQNEMIEMMPGVKFDRHRIGSKFGSVIKDKDVNVNIPYKPTVLASESVANGSAPDDDDSELSHVQVQFHAANPRNNQKIQKTFLTVEKKNNDDWNVVRTDGDWDTEFKWIAGIDDKYAFGLSPLSRSIVTWNLNRAQQQNALLANSQSLAGTYRICYFGDHKEIIGKNKIKPFEGCSSTFTVVDA